METRTQSEKEHTQRALEEAKAAMRETGAHLKNSASEMAEAGREAVHRFGSAWESTKKNIQERAATSARATDRVYREHPYQTIGIAFEIGAILGFLILRSKPTETPTG